MTLLIESTGHTFSNPYVPQCSMTMRNFILIVLTMEDDRKERDWCSGMYSEKGKWDQVDFLIWRKEKRWTQLLSWSRLHPSSAYTRPPPASTFLTCFNVPHMFQQSVLHLLQRSAHASHGLHLLQQSTSERGLSILHTRLALTRVNVLLLVMFVYLSINSIAASHISLAFNSVFFGYIS